MSQPVALWFAQTTHQARDPGDRILHCPGWMQEALLDFVSEADHEPFFLRFGLWWQVEQSSAGIFYSLRGESDGSASAV